MSKSSSDEEPSANDTQKFGDMVIRSPGWKNPAVALRWSKFFLVATGIFWGLCMQLIYYQGGGHPLTALPNVDWCSSEIQTRNLPRSAQLC